MQQPVVDMERVQAGNAEHRINTARFEALHHEMSGGLLSHSTSSFLRSTSFRFFRVFDPSRRSAQKTSFPPLPGKSLCGTYFCFFVSHDASAKCPPVASFGTGTFQHLNGTE
jgi:hypothetical protein